MHYYMFVLLAVSWLPCFDAVTAIRDGCVHHAEQNSAQGPKPGGWHSADFSHHRTTVSNILDRVFDGPSTDHDTGRRHTVLNDENQQPVVHALYTQVVNGHNYCVQFTGVEPQCDHAGNCELAYKTCEVLAYQSFQEAAPEISGWNCED